MTKFLLDSGDPLEYREIADLAKSKGSELWGATTNPSLIAKKLAGQKFTKEEAFNLQKKIILEIVDIVPGAVSAEVYADQDTTGEEMAEQGREIATWHERVVIKLPTNLEGFKARSLLRKEGIGINNTLVFSQEQVFAISLHERIMKQTYGPAKNQLPSFISPFVGRLDDKGENGLVFLQHAVTMTQTMFEKDLVWMLEASIRSLAHFKAGIEMGCELTTVPAKVYREWFGLTDKQRDEIDLTPPEGLADIPAWQPTDALMDISTEEDFMTALASGDLDITHPLTTAGIDKFVEDWKAILA